MGAFVQVFGGSNTQQAVSARQRHEGLSAETETTFGRRMDTRSDSRRADRRGDCVHSQAQGTVAIDYSPLSFPPLKVTITNPNLGRETLHHTYVAIQKDW